MRFSSDSDIKMFFLELGQDIPENLENFKPSKEMLESFFLKRNKSISGLKDFRKKQITKNQWRSNRYEMMKGIKTFHKSTAGKLFHRKLARFLATRISLTGQSILSLREGSGNFYEDISDICKALSSFKTHAFILLENFMPSSMHTDYLIFLEEIIPEISKIENAIISLQEIPLESLDILAASINFKGVLDNLEEGNNFQFLEKSFKEFLENNKENEHPYLSVIEHLKSL